MSGIDRQSESMLVRGEDLDRLLLLAGEVIIASSNQGIVSKSLSDLFDKDSTVDQETVTTAKDLASSTSLLSSDLHNLVQSIRTVDLKDMGFRARRLVRDISRKTGKPINFEVIGEDTTIDKAIVEKLYDPISHQLRNAVDHGIEDIQTRMRNGKPEEGRVVLRVYNTEHETFIEIEDDGAGIDLDALYERGVAEGLISKGDTVTEDVALELMCSPGITTSETVSKVSGRGVGMDVVRTHIDDLSGTISFNTEPGRGTTFTFRIPLISAVNIVDALVVRADKNMFAFPISNVVASISLTQNEISSAMKEGKMINYLGSLLPLHSLNSILDRRHGETDWDDKETIAIIIIEHKARRVALTVSEFLAPQKLVIIPFDESLSITGLVGSTILGGRRLGFIIDVPSLIGLAIDKESRVAAKKHAESSAEQVESIEISTDGELYGTGIDTEEVYDYKSEKDSAVKQEFIAELEKLIPELNEGVFSLESDPINDDRINAVFRLLHTIKGDLIMMGLPKGGETVHSIESVLDHARSHELAITPEVMDIIMDGVSYIEEVVQNARAGTWEDKAREDILERNAELFPEPSFDQEEIIDVASSEVKLSHESSYRVLMHRKNNTPFYHIYIEFDSGGQPSFLVACLIYKRICEVGDVLGTVPFLADIEKGLMAGQIKLFFASNWDPDLLEKRLKGLFTKHYGASLVKLMSVRY